jgi:alkaline phosphatase
MPPQQNAVCDMKILSKYAFFSLCLGWSVYGWAQARPYPPQPVPRDHATNVILMIGDGMGLAQVSAALYANFNQLHIGRLPILGFHKSYSSDQLVTDSAAGATAFACGRKTFNSAIGLTKDSLPCKTLLEEAEERGLATGLIVTSTIVHATPAAFAAHAISREYYEDIALDMADSGADLLIGGGMQYFTRRESDERNLVADLKAKGYVVEDYMNTPMNGFKWNPNKQLAYFTADKQPLNVAAGRDYLALAAKMGPLFLEKRSKEGFFLMIEGSQIDWACHARDGKLAIKETLDFDRAVGEALKFAQNNQNTLLIVTADHETGGMALMPGSKMGKVETSFTTNNHTASLIPVFAYGPGSACFSGIYENTDIYYKIREALGFDFSSNDPASEPAIQKEAQHTVGESNRQP